MKKFLLFLFCLLSITGSISYADDDILINDGGGILDIIFTGGA